MALKGKIFKFKAGGKSGGSVGCTASVLERERETQRQKTRERKIIREGIVCHKIMVWSIKKNLNMDQIISCNH